MKKKTYKKIPQKLIDQTMEWFDFETVHDHMVRTDWRWLRDGVMRVPTIVEIKENALRLLNQMTTKYDVVKTGGFVLRIDRKANPILSFEVADSSDMYEE